MERLDLLTPIHKGIRALIYHLGFDLQRTDFSDPPASAEVVRRLLHDLDLLHRHGRDEEKFIFPRVGRFEIGLVGLLRREHEEIEVRIVEAREGGRELETLAVPEARPAAGARLNRVFNALAAFYLAHMNHEEAMLLPVSWRHFTDAELGAIRGEIQKSMTPDVLREWMRWIFSALNDAELADLLKGMRSSAPPEILEGTLVLARTVLGAERWPHVAARAGLP
ncbi:MAG: hemerythrin domain-containing protein [Candidatus Eisenbacteria bacterium]